MKRVTGIGGVFFKAKDPRALWTWYREHLGIDVQEYGVAVFHWVDDDGEPVNGATAWRIASDDDSAFAPGKTFTVNYRVADLDALLEALKEEGCNVSDDVIDDAEYGKFGSVTDPEGNKVALWEPPAGE
jgi:predicted enzyme related to lactoylglutathione lyase